MAWYPDEAPVPGELRTEEFLLRPLRAADAELDYDAVIDSRELLLVYSSGRWPAEGFSLADNRADLAMHEREHEARAAFTYTVLTPDGARCLGCVYIHPLRPMLRRLVGRGDYAAIPGAEDAARDDPAWGDVRDDEALVRFWVRPECVAADLDRRLLAALLAWFAREWPFSRVAFLANRNQRRLLQLFADAGLRQRYTVETPKEPRAYHICGRDSREGAPAGPYSS